MTTPKEMNALKNTNEAIAGIQKSIEPVLEKLSEGSFKTAELTAEAKASVALSVGMMKYMGARLRGLDHGRNPDDPLRQELNNMKRVLAEIKKRVAERKKKRSAEKEQEETPTKKPQNEKSPKPSKSRKRKSPMSMKSESSRKKTMKWRILKADLMRHPNIGIDFMMKYQGSCLDPLSFCLVPCYYRGFMDHTGERSCNFFSWLTCIEPWSYPSGIGYRMQKFSRNP